MPARRANTTACHTREFFEFSCPTLEHFTPGQVCNYGILSVFSLDIPWHSHCWRNGYHAKTHVCFHRGVCGGVDRGHFDPAPPALDRNARYGSRADREARGGRTRQYFDSSAPGHDRSIHRAPVGARSQAHIRDRGRHSCAAARGNAASDCARSRRRPPVVAVTPPRCLNVARLPIATALRFPLRTNGSPVSWTG